MAILHLDSAGSNTSPHETWAKAATSWATAIGAMSAGDVLYVDDGYTESLSADAAVTWASTEAAPCKVYSVDKASETDGTTCTYSKGAEWVGGNNDYSITMTNATGALTVFHGVRFRPGKELTHTGTNGAWIYNDCTMGTGRTGTARDINFTANDAIVVLRDTVFEFQATASELNVGNGGVLVVEGCSVDSTAGVAMTTIFGPIVTRGGGTVIVRNNDFSNMANGGEIFNSLPALSGQIYHLHGNILPTNGVLSTDETAPYYSAEIFRSPAGGTTRYDTEYRDSWGKTVVDTAIYRAASDSVEGQALSLKMVSGANAIEDTLCTRVLVSEFYAAANPTLTVEIVHDAQGGGTGSEFNDDELWLEIDQPGASGTSLDLAKDNRVAYNATPALVGTGTGSGWTGTGGFTSAKPETIAVTLAGGGAGIHRVWVCLAKASSTVYVDPEVAVS